MTNIITTLREDDTKIETYFHLLTSKKPSFIETTNANDIYCLYKALEKYRKEKGILWGRMKESEVDVFYDNSDTKLWCHECCYYKNGCKYPDCLLFEKERFINTKRMMGMYIYYTSPFLLNESGENVSYMKL
jgi:hypothetical protein